jgi:hypothetical protein
VLPRLVEQFVEQVLPKHHLSGIPKFQSVLLSGRSPKGELLPKQPHLLIQPSALFYFDKSI